MRAGELSKTGIIPAVSLRARSRAEYNCGVRCRPGDQGAGMDAISQILAGMGSTPDQVAETLLHARVQGMRDSTSLMNPVVRLLNRTLNIGGRLEVGAGGTLPRLQLEGKVKEVPLPVAVQVFLDGFHRGLYPDLETSGV